MNESMLERAIRLLRKEDWDEEAQFVVDLARERDEALAREAVLRESLQRAYSHDDYSGVEELLSDTAGLVMAYERAASSAS